MEEIRNRFKIRGLQDQFEKNPLKDFWGVMEEPKEKVVDQGDRGVAQICVLGFHDVEVIESDSPWPFPTTTVELWTSERKGTDWHTFTESVLKFLGDDQELSDLVGLKVHMKKTPGHRAWNRAEGKVGEKSRWEMVEVQGSPTGSNGRATVDPLEVVLTLLVGKTEQEFMPAALRDPVIKKQPEMLKGVVHGSLVQELVKQGLVHKDSEGRYQLGAE